MILQEIRLWPKIAMLLPVSLELEWLPGIWYFHNFRTD